MIKKAVMKGAIAVPFEPRISIARAVAIADARELRKFSFCVTAALLYHTAELKTRQ